MSDYVRQPSHGVEVLLLPACPGFPNIIQCMFLGLQASDLNIPQGTSKLHIRIFPY